MQNIVKFEVTVFPGLLRFGPQDTLMKVNVVSSIRAHVITSEAAVKMTPPVSQTRTSGIELVPG